jgi:hypothetical protein
MTPPFCTPPIDLLGQAIEQVRLMLSGRRQPLGVRLRVFWAAANAARDFAASDVLKAALLELARDTGLIADLGPRGYEDVEHILSWASRGLNPFEAGPLQ